MPIYSDTKISELSEPPQIKLQEVKLTSPVNKAKKPLRLQSSSKVDCSKLMPESPSKSKGINKDLQAVVPAIKHTNTRVFKTKSIEKKKHKL